MSDVNDGKLASLAQSLHDCARLAKIDGFKDIARLQNNMLGIGKIIHGHAAPQTQHGLASMMRVKITGRTVRTDVGRTKTAHESPAEVGKRPLSVRPENGLPAVPVLSFGDLLRNVVQSFVPGHGTPFSFAARPLANKWRLWTLIVFKKSFSGHTTSA